MAQLVSSIKLSELRLTKSLLVNFSNKDAKVKKNNNGQLYFHCYNLARQKSFRLLREVTSAQFVDIFFFTHYSLTIFVYGANFHSQTLL